MNRSRDLARQLSVVMIGMAIAGLFLLLFVFYLVYELIRIFAPQCYPEASQLMPTSIDFVALLVAELLWLIVATFVAIRIARRIARPLQSVASAAQQIAQGNLSARAAPDNHMSEEAAALIVNFNDMAGQLEAMAQRMVTWNAQISHELRTPITVLTGRLQGVIDGVFEPDRKLVEGLLTQVFILHRLVEDLRVVSLAGSGWLNLKFSKVMLANEIAALIELVAPDLKTAGLVPRLDLDTGEATVDIARVRQALLALIENARRYADPGNLSIILRLSPDEVIIEVIDSGPGLPVDFALYAFDEFSRAESTWRSGHAGSGLGLSIVRAIAQAHGGEACYRRSGKGSAFTLQLLRHPRARN